MSPLPIYYYLISITFDFWASGIILSRETFKSPSLSSAPLTSQLSAIEKDFLKYLFAIPLNILPLSFCFYVWFLTDSILNWSSANSTFMSFLLNPAKATSTSYLFSPVFTMS